MENRSCRSQSRRRRHASMRPRRRRRGELKNLHNVIVPHFASMRPRRRRRGERNTTVRFPPAQQGFNAATASPPWRTTSRWPPTKASLKLQCGHGVAAVENAVAQGAGNQTEQLQCGHGVAAVENTTCSLQRRPMTSALQCGHGVAAVENPIQLPQAGAGAGASMRPRRRRRGERCKSGSVRPE